MMQKKALFSTGKKFSHYCAFFTLFAAAIISAACSVDYGTVYKTEDTVPELMLDDAAFCRTEGGLETARVTSTRLEEFKDSGKILAQDIQFQTMDKEGKTTASGRAGIMYAGTKNEVYEFYQGIEIESRTHNVKITGESLRWDGKTEQLTGERSKEITIQKDGIILSGKGFSASAISEQFSFAGSVSGICEEKSEEE